MARKKKTFKRKGAVAAGRARGKIEKGTCPGRERQNKRKLTKGRSISRFN